MGIALPPAQNGLQAKPSLAFAYDPAVTRKVYSDSALERLRAVCTILDPEPLQEFDSERAQEILSKVQILATGWGCPLVDEDVVGRAPHLRLIAHGAGTVKSFISNNVLHGSIAFTNAAAANAVPVAEYTLAMILCSNKRLLDFRDMYRETRVSVWRHPILQTDLGNIDKTIGIVGASRIGIRVMQLLRPFDFDVLLYDPFISPQQATEMGARLVSLDVLMAAADIVSIHAPAVDATHHLVDARRLGLMREGATLINTARGSIVEHAALEVELVSGRIIAVLDVTEPDVLPANSPLYDLPNVFLTPHIAGAVGAERRRLGDMAVEEIQRFVEGRPLQHLVQAGRLEQIA